MSCSATCTGLNVQPVTGSDGVCTCKKIAGVTVGDQPIDEWVIWTLVALAAATVLILIILGIWSWYRYKKYARENCPNCRCETLNQHRRCVCGCDDPPDLDWLAHERRLPWYVQMRHMCCPTGRVSNSAERRMRMRRRGEPDTEEEEYDVGRGGGGTDEEYDRRDDVDAEDVMRQMERETKLNGDVGAEGDPHYGNGYASGVRRGEGDDREYRPNGVGGGGGESGDYGRRQRIDDVVDLTEPGVHFEEDDYDEYDDDRRNRRRRRRRREVRETKDLTIVVTRESAVHARQEQSHGQDRGQQRQRQKGRKKQTMEPISTRTEESVLMDLSDAELTPRHQSLYQQQQQVAMRPQQPVVQHQVQQQKITSITENAKLQRDTVFGLVAWKMQRSKAIQELLDNVSFTDSESRPSTPVTPTAGRQDAAHRRPASGIARPASQTSVMTNERPMMTETNFLRNFQKDDMVVAKASGDDGLPADAFKGRNVVRVDHAMAAADGMPSDAMRGGGNGREGRRQPPAPLPIDPKQLEKDAWNSFRDQWYKEQERLNKPPRKKVVKNNVVR